MNIVVGHIGQLVIDDIGNAGNINTACGHIRCDKHIDLAAAEGLYCPVALVLVLVAMDGGGVEAVGHQPLHQLFRPVFGTGKDKRQCRAILRQDLAQLGGLFLFGQKMHRLGDFIGGLARARDLYPLGVGQIGARQLLHLLWHGCRKQHRLARRSKAWRDLAQCMNEAKVKHLIGFIQNEMPHRAQIDRAAIHQVDQTARRGNQNIGAMRQKSDLFADRLTADHGRNA